MPRFDTEPVSRDDSTITHATFAALGYGFLPLVELAFIALAILWPHREPASRIAWVVVIAVVPVLGIVVYILFGETNIGRRRSARERRVLDAMPAVASASPDEASHLESTVPEPYQHLFHTAHSISGFDTFGGNSARLFSVSDETIESMVADIDAAQEHVHLLFYIWLADNDGCKMVEALNRAAGRGVNCRVMADGLGSRAMISSEHWKAMSDAGVHVAVALPIGSVVLRSLRWRVDLRNHRKIVMIDDRITYCGSQNCADAEFRVNTK